MKPSWNGYASASQNGALALMYCLGRTLIRHTQQQTLGGDTVCKLPAKSEERVPGAQRWPLPALPACLRTVYGLPEGRVALLHGACEVSLAHWGPVWARRGLFKVCVASACLNVRDSL